MRAVLRSSVVPALLFVSLAAPTRAQETPPPSDDVRRLEAEIAALREDFAARLGAR